MQIFHAKTSLKKRGVNVLNKLPNEVITSILTLLSIPDLLSILRLPWSRIHTLAKEVLVAKMVDTDNCRLRLYFDQESHWRFTVDMKLLQATERRLAFVPVDPSNLNMYMYHSKVLRRPNLYKVSLVGPDFAVDDDSFLLDNLLGNKQPSLDIKDYGVYQKNHQITKLHNILMAYRIEKVPETRVKARSGERVFRPLGFECSFDFFCQTKNTMQRVFDSLHAKPTKRQIDERTVTRTSRLPLGAPNDSVAEASSLPPASRFNGKFMKINLTPVLTTAH
ncbi:hypothetical protein K501DRAFT_286380 [Backusella circina FSU 941]|nr:hypothetical protein K501DRAFT_286380 [Backusella circina FSU 941]